MNLQTLQISKQQAAEAVIHYRRSLKVRYDAEYEAILRGYNQVLKGRKLIELSKVIAAGGVDEKWRPRLAVMRADETRCFVSVRSDGSVHFHTNRWRVRIKSLNLKFPTGTLPGWTPHPQRGPWSVDAHGVVPLIPAQYRPAADLSNFHILWEAEWKEFPRDPALLKHLGGDLWAVLAVWDLTDLEMAVLGGRRSA